MATQQRSTNHRATSTFGRTNSVNDVKPVTTCWRQVHGRGLNFETGSECWLGLSVTGGVGTKQPDDVSMGGGDGSGDGQRSDP